MMRLALSAWRLGIDIAHYAGGICGALLEEPERPTIARGPRPAAWPRGEKRGRKA